MENVGLASTQPLVNDSLRIQFDDDDMLIALLGFVVISKSLHTREPIRDSHLQGSSWMHELLFGHSDRIYQNLRMERHVFNNLCNQLKERGWLQDSRYVGVEEQVGIFIFLIGHVASNRDLCERFQHSGETISKYFKKVLRAMLKLAEEVIKPPPFNVIPSEIRCNPKLFPYFKDCIGAIDGTHISATVPLTEQIPYKGRKGITTQNVMCACSLDMKFTFIYAGWEGSANDCRVFKEALSNESLRFPKPPPGKYYAVDSGYPATTGFLSPFRGERYHLNDFRGRGGRARTARELFNHRHSSLQNVIERSFGVLKNHFPILRKMPPFTIKQQSYIVIACCAIHNYIRDEQQMDGAFGYYGQQDLPIGEPDSNEAEEVDVTAVPTIEISLLRNNIANELASDNNLTPI